MADVANTDSDMADENPSQTKEEGQGSVAENNNTNEQKQADQQSVVDGESGEQITGTTEGQSGDGEAERSKPSELTGEQDGRAGENSEAEGLEEGRSSSSLTDASGNAAEDAVGGTDEEGGTVRNGSSEPEQVNGCSSAKMAAGPASCEDAKEEAGDANPVPEDSAGVKLEVDAGGKDAGSPEQNDGGQTPEMQDTNAVDCQTRVEAAVDECGEQQEETGQSSEQQSPAQGCESRSDQAKTRSITVDNPENLKELCVKSGEQQTGEMHCLVQSVLAGAGQGGVEWSGYFSGTSPNDHHVFMVTFYSCFCVNCATRSLGSNPQSFSDLSDCYVLEVALEMGFQCTCVTGWM